MFTFDTALAYHRACLNYGVPSNGQVPPDVRPNRVAQRIITPFLRPLGTGAVPVDLRARVQQRADNFVHRYAEPTAACLPHPCKSQPSLTKVAKAGLSGAWVGLSFSPIPATLAGVLATAGHTLCYGPILGIKAGSAAVVSTVFGSVGLCALLGAGLAAGIWLARSEGERDVARCLEEASGYFAVLPRLGLVALQRAYLHGTAHFAAL